MWTLQFQCQFSIEIWINSQFSDISIHTQHQWMRRNDTQPDMRILYYTNLICFTQFTCSNALKLSPLWPLITFDAVRDNSCDRWRTEIKSSSNTNPPEMTSLLVTTERQIWTACSSPLYIGKVVSFERVCTYFVNLLWIQRDLFQELRHGMYPRDHCDILLHLGHLDNYYTLKSWHWKVV